MKALAIMFSLIFSSAIWADYLVDTNGVVHTGKVKQKMVHFYVTNNDKKEKIPVDAVDSFSVEGKVYKRICPPNCFKSSFYEIVADGPITLYCQTNTISNFNPSSGMTTRTQKDYVVRKNGEWIKFNRKTLLNVLSGNQESMMLLEEQRKRTNRMVIAGLFIVPLVFYQFVIPEPKEYLIKAIQAYNRGASTTTKKLP